MPGSARERQVAHRRAHRAAAAANLHARAGRGVLPAHERKGQGAAESGRARGAGDAADGGVAGPHLGADGGWLAALDDEAAQVTIDMAAVANPHHDLLPRIAAFRLRHEGVEGNFRQEHAGVNVTTEAWRAALDAQRL